jgi:predicted  nucleic acid-binding Zn-ribbon protein
LDEINHLKDEISKNEEKVKELELKLATDEVYIKNKEMEYNALKESQGGDDTENEEIRTQLDEANRRLEEVEIECNDTKTRYEELEIKSNELEGLQVEFKENLLLSENVHRDLQRAYDEHLASTALANLEYEKTLESQLGIIFVNMHACIHFCTYMYNTSLYKCIYVYMCIYNYICTSVHMFVYTYAYLYNCVHDHV